MGGNGLSRPGGNLGDFLGFRVKGFMTYGFSVSRVQGRSKFGFWDGTSGSEAESENFH